MSKGRSGVVILAVAACAAAAGGAAGIGPSTPGPSPRRERVDEPAIRAARNLRPVSGTAARLTVSAPRIRAWADRQRGDIPLPEGGNFNGIGWERLPGMLTIADAHAVLQYNARCQWLRAARDGRDVATSKLVLHAAGGWPALRGLEEPEHPLPTDPVTACEASHRREVSYATRMGLEASR